MLHYNIEAAENALVSRRKAHIGMKWFRSNIKHGSGAALVALALQLALTFGHCHAVAAQAVPAIQAGPALSDVSYANGLRAPDAIGESAQQQPAPDPDSDQQQNDGCPICAVIVLAGAGLLSTPPLLLLPQSEGSLYLPPDAGFVHLDSPRVAFQPRAPPIG
jgi:hypothetical protein